MVNPVENWRKSSLYDLSTAGALLQTGHYLSVIFHCHLAVEKMLKAVVENVTGKTPPKTHNLRNLLTESNISVTENVSDLIDELSDLSVPMRYPIDFEANSDVYTKNVAEDYFRRTEESVKWIEKSL